MEIHAVKKTMSEAEAMKVAEKRGNWLGRLLLGKKKITLKLMYLESREITFDMTYVDSPLLKLMKRKSPQTPAKQKILMLAEGTRGNPAYLDSPVRTQVLQIDDESMIQKTEIPEEKLIDEARRLARRMVKRQVGRDVLLDVLSVRSIYRPYYIAFYGDLVENTKVRYIAIPADGNVIERTF